MSPKDSLIDSMASIIGHGLAIRFPDLKFLPVEFVSTWIRPFVEKVHRSGPAAAQIFDEDPFVTFTGRSTSTSSTNRPQGLLDLGIPADHLMFGSDFPHPEGMADACVLRDRRAATKDAQTLIMGGTLERLLL